MQQVVMTGSCPLPHVALAEGRALRDKTRWYRESFALVGELTNEDGRLF